MKKCILCFISCISLCFFVACGNGIIHTDELTTETDYEYERYTELDYSKHGAESAPQRVTWEDYPEYVGGIPKPSFVIHSPTEVPISGVDMLTFSAAEGTTLEQLQEYLTSLELSEFVNAVEQNTEDYYSGTVYRDGVAVLYYAYRYGIIKISVFKINN